jgi:hypothetical protein
MYRRSGTAYYAKDKTTGRAEPATMHTKIARDEAAAI